MDYQEVLRKRIEESRERVMSLSDVTGVQLEEKTLNREIILNSLHIQYRNLSERHALLSLYNVLYDNEMREAERENLRLLSAMEQKLKVVARAACKSIRIK